MPSGFSRNSSVFMPSGWTLVLYDGPFYEGNSVILDQSSDCLASVINATTFARGIGSLKVYTGGC